MVNKKLPISAEEGKRVAQFALKCYGWNLNIAASVEVIRIARGWEPHFSKNTTLYMRRIIRQIAIGYREVMDL